MTVVALELGPSSPKIVPLGDGTKEKRYGEITFKDIIRERSGWLLFFFGGLLAAAVVVESFEVRLQSSNSCTHVTTINLNQSIQEILKEHVELSYFVPLLIGHGGNTGAQSNAEIIRSLARGHVRPQDYLMVLQKESFAGAAMGASLGILVYLCSFVWTSLPRDVALTVAISLPIVSIWANTLGALFPLLFSHLGYNPAVTSAPLMTTVVDATGLAIYLGIAMLVIGL